MQAYVDTSVIVAITLGEIGADAILEKVRPFELVAAPLLEAEWRSACRRNETAPDPALLREILWVHTERPLSEELERVFAAGYVRGADAWHLATALYLAPDPSELTFLTLDDRQRGVAEALGFRT
jgi:predicted nucleic acid-binding protein